MGEFDGLLGELMSDLQPRIDKEQRELLDWLRKQPLSTQEIAQLSEFLSQLSPIAIVLVGEAIDEGNDRTVLETLRSATIESRSCPDRTGSINERICQTMRGLMRPS